MIVSYSESIDIDPSRKPDIFAFAGTLNVYKHGMRMRDCIKAIMAVRGTGWVTEMLALYPINETYPPRAKRARRTKAEPVEKDGKPKTVDKPSPVTAKTSSK